MLQLTSSVYGGFEDGDSVGRAPFEADNYRSELLSEIVIDHAQKRTGVGEVSVVEMVVIEGGGGEEYGLRLAANVAADETLERC